MQAHRYRRCCLGAFAMFATLVGAWLNAVSLVAPIAAQETPVRLAEVLEDGWEEAAPAPLLSDTLFAADPLEGDEAEELIPGLAPPVETPSFGFCPEPCPSQDPACCVRGRDHTGEYLFGSRFGGWLDACGPVLEWHNPFFTWSDCWVIPAERYGDYCRCQRELRYDSPVCGTNDDAGTLRKMHCALQCKWVNYRPGSQYLQGCMPEGYDLLPFIRSVPHVELHSAPLNPDQAVESFETNTLEARATDGDSFKSITAVSADITLPEGALPNDSAKVSFAAVAPRMHVPGTGRDWCAVTFQWNASLLNHQPLYFEEVSLERHGYSWGMAQPVLSGVRFFGTVPLLPYLMTANPQHLTKYTLGNKRPGSPAPYVHQRIPRHLDATLIEAGVIVGVFLIIP